MGPRPAEGVRISRVLQTMRQTPLSGPAADLRAHLFGTALPPAAPPGGVLPPAEARPGRAVTAEADGAVRVTVPLHITVSVTSPAVSAAVPPSTAITDTPRAVPAPALQVNGHVSPAEADLKAALAGLQAGRARPYYDAEADRQERQAYYAGLVGTDGARLGRTLTDLLEQTHERWPAYKPMRLLYPWVDLHPDRQLRSIYSGQSFAPEEFIRADAATEAARIQRWQELTLREAVLGPEALAAEMDALEDALAFNCEHVVPQSWFGKREPMRGDLHHLFACETNCNSFRGNIPYFDFADTEETVRTSCGRREAQAFEPSAGKDAVARATLYFVLRYPELVGDTARELHAARLARSRPGQHLRTPPQLRHRRGPGQPQPAHRPPGMGSEHRLHPCVVIGGSRPGAPAEPRRTAHTDTR